ncbi:CehA/McbA family metallohydrolase [Vibrio chagasii]|uniref:CehA/McbA family metallohydrolase n=1 Tax=Vibrio chagasii TaxID=170679 RepID=UPI001EFD1E40|nr:CehA/McbA family metallohydrolase [Vibrio chagasii]MCG9562316.1 CehA/McbA family metallohydrolase [Vibrio chagasii]
MTQFQGELPFGRVRIPFDVPAGSHSVTITGTTVKKGFLYAAAYDANQAFRGKVLFEKAHKSLATQPKNSGLGAIDGAIPSGQWFLELYNLEGEFRTERAMQYQVDVLCSDELVNNDVELELTPTVTSDHDIEFDYSHMLSSDSRWYRGDLHAHTQLSDGHNTLAAAKGIVESQGLDFIFFTEHNICQPTLPVSNQCLFLPALEVTTDLGHFNVHGPVKSLDLRYVEHSSQATMEAGLNLAKSGHSSLGINHPMMKPWHWHYDQVDLGQVSTFEVCCDPTWSTSPKATEEALLVLNEMWNCGQRITAIGGSDSHLEPHERNPKADEPSIYGDPSTFVYSHGLSGEGILAGLRNGQVYLERRCGLKFDINLGDVLPGNDSQGQPLTYRIAVSDSENPYYAECVVDGEIVDRIALSDELQSIHIDEGYRWCRVDIRRGDLPFSTGSNSTQSSSNEHEFEGCINAVFDGKQPEFNQPLVRTWGELMERMSRDEV